MQIKKIIINLGFISIPSLSAMEALVSCPNKKSPQYEDLMPDSRIKFNECLLQLSRILGKYATDCRKPSVSKHFNETNQFFTRLWQEKKAKRWKKSELPKIHTYIQNTIEYNQAAKDLAHKFISRDSRYTLPLDKCTQDLQFLDERLNNYSWKI